eukprot:3423319-Pleurochrysis_carterae.AAC.4
MGAFSHWHARTHTRERPTTLVYAHVQTIGDTYASRQKCTNMHTRSRKCGDARTRGRVDQFRREKEARTTQARRRHT